MSAQRKHVEIVTPATLNQYVPYSQEAEEAVIGAVIINPASFFSVASFLNAEDFFILRHQFIWQAIERVIGRGDDLDYVSAVQELRNMGKLDEIGGPAYVTQLINNTPTSIHAEVYGRLVERAAVRRRMLSSVDRIKLMILDEELTVERVIDDAFADFIHATGRTILQSTMTLGEALEDYSQKVADRRANGGEVGLPTGLKDLDKTIGGLPRGKVTLVGGVTGMGKTAFCMTVALNVARLGARVAMFPLEQNRERMVNRLVALETGIPRARIETGQIADGLEWERYCEAKERMARLPVIIYDRPKDPDFRMSPRHLLTICTALVHEYGLDLVIVDYMGLMNSGGRYDESDYNDKVFVSQAMPLLAEKLNIPFLVAAQVNERKISHRREKRPELGDLMYVGEKDADVVLFLYREVKYNPETTVSDEAEIIIAKNRDFGTTGTVYVNFDGEGFTNPVEHDLKLW